MMEITRSVSRVSRCRNRRVISALDGARGGKESEGEDALATAGGTTVVKI